MEIQTRKIKTPDGENFTIVPVFTRQSKLRGISLLQRVRKIILEEPKRVNMAVPQIRADDGFGFKQFSPECNPYYRTEIVKDFPTCNTVGCVAGWGDAVVLGGTAVGEDERTWNEVRDRAVEFFEFREYGIDYDRLFYVGEWDSDLRERYVVAEKNNDHKGMAKVTADCISRIIKEMRKNGKQ